MNLGIAASARASKRPINQLRTARSWKPLSRCEEFRKSNFGWDRYWLTCTSEDSARTSLLSCLRPLVSLSFLPILFLSFFLILGEHHAPDLPSYSGYNQEGNEFSRISGVEMPDTLPVHHISPRRSHFHARDEFFATRIESSRLLPRDGTTIARDHLFLLLLHYDYVRNMSLFGNPDQTKASSLNDSGKISLFVNLTM